MTRNPHSVIFLTTAILLTASAFSSSCAAEPVDFRRDIALVLEKHCLSCHNNRDRRGGLSLQSANALRQGGESGDVVFAGEPDSSYLLDLVTPEGNEAEMPKGEPPLTPDEVAAIRRWIEEGAHWPAELELTPPALWSLAQIQRPAVPEVDSTPDFPVRNPIDAFVAAKRMSVNLQPAPQADRRTLLRRLYLDLIGLLPEPAAVEAFVRDERPEAYDRLVSELLASPHFGERWGRHWLDLARYADSDGYLGDNIRPHAWVYREWVIDAVNADMPFDRFSIEQLAGDLLDKPTLDQKIATGFHRNTLRNTEAGVDLELYRTKEIVDRVSTTGMVWLGLTLGCAECHDHKHDPVSQKEFYQLYAFFNNADEVGVTATRQWEFDEYEQAMKDWQPAFDQLAAKLKEFEKEDLSDKQREKIAKQLDESNTKPNLKSIEDCYRTDAPGWTQLKQSLQKQLESRPPRPATKAPVFAEKTKDRRETYVHIRGVYNRPGDKVEPGTPAVLPALAVRGDAPDRLDLARWLFRDDNPLTARVAVNRVWQHLFGQGLVATSNDFGTKGSPPTHPELLDLLATEYRRLGWSRKALIRLIVSSSTYRMASAVNSVPDQADANNQWLWRQNSYRVSAETVRDVHLAASGLLDRTIGRKGIFPPLPAFVTEVGRSVKWPVSEGGDRYRRGMYILFKRTVPYPMLMTFDAPDAALSCSRRERSNTPLQALTLLNDPVFFECAQTLGQQMAAKHKGNPEAAIREMFLRCLSRPPAERELQYLESAFRDLQQLSQQSEETQSPADTDLAAMTAVARIILNLDEFITRD